MMMSIGQTLNIFKYLCLFYWSNVRFDSPDRILAVTMLFYHAFSIF